MNYRGPKTKNQLLIFIQQRFNNKLLKNHFLYFFVSFLIAITIISCNKDYHPVGMDLFVDQTLRTKTKNIPAFTFQESINQVQTNVQPLAQLGMINHPVFGKSEASIVTQIAIRPDLFFGNLKQNFENQSDGSNPDIIDEEEKVKEVFLEIPFFSNTNDSDNDGVIDSLDEDPNDPASNSDGDELTDIVEFQSGLNPLSSDSDGDGILDHNDNDNSAYDSENSVYDIDSIYGNRNSEFTLQVHELTYYLNDYDPLTNFQSSQIYYSNRDYYSEGFVGATLFDGRIKLNFDEIRFYYNEDDPDTPDIDETTQVENRLTPRLRIPLDPNFFQEKLIDLEGTESLLSEISYQKDMRGLIIRGENFSDDLYMLLDIQNAEIKISYEFKDNNTQGTLEDLTDDTIEILERNFSLSLGGAFLNVLNNEIFESSINKRIADSKNNIPTDKLFIQSSRLHGKIRLFSNEDPNVNEEINSIRDENLLVNQANLIFHVDPETPIEQYNAQRLYLFNLNNGAPMIDYFSDGSTSNFGTNANKAVFGGKLELDENGNPSKYKFNITNHISNIIRNDSLNYDLGMTVTANIDTPLVISAINQDEDQEIRYPLASTLNPLGTVLIGSHPDSLQFDKRVRLELIYSSY